MVPSPDHPLGLLDLTERASLLQHLLKSGFPVYRLDWGTSSARCEEMGLVDYIEEALGGAGSAVREHSGEQRISWVGYALGGTLALLHAAASLDEEDGNLICLAAPARFDRRLAKVEPPTCKSSHRAGTTFDQLMAVPHPLPRRPRAELHALLERGDGLCSEADTLGPEADWRALERVQMPFLNVTASHDAWVPRDLTEGMVEQVGSQDRSEFEIAGDHFDLLAGETAYHEAWPALERWLSARSL